MKQLVVCLALMVLCVGSLFAGKPMVKPSQYPCCSTSAGIVVQPVVHGWEDGTSGASSGGEATR